MSRSAFTFGMSEPAAGTVNIVSPADWATVEGPKVIVKGTVDDAQLNTVMIVVTGQTSTQTTSYVAQVNGKYFAAAVNLNDGANNVRAVASYLNGQQKETTITLTAVNKQQSVRITAAPTAGTTTLKADGTTSLDVSFRVTTSLVNPVSSYAWDFSGDGVADLSCGSMTGVKASYRQTGLYLATVTVTDSQGNKYTDTVIVNVLDKLSMNDFFTQKWNAMKQALANGDLAGALNHCAEESKPAFQDQFTAFAQDLPRVVADMGFFSLVRIIDNNTAECELRSVKDGVTYSFQVLFSRDENGNWGIESF